MQGADELPECAPDRRARRRDETDAAHERARPMLRGASQPIAFLAALVGWGVLVAASPSARAVAVASIYGSSVAVMFGVSALYHLPLWSPRWRHRLRRADHGAIFLLIAGTYTPVVLALPQGPALALLAFVWTCALFGICTAAIWPDAPRYVSVPIYLGLGWAVLPLLAPLRSAFGAGGLALLFAGGIAYSAGAAIYWLRRPDPWPRIFGYHEIFHLLVIVAAGCHFAVVREAVSRLE